MGELAFQFLGVRTVGCKKRFVCEFDFRARANPITRMMYSLVGRNFFQQYRQLEENVSKPETFEDCAKIFDECEDAEKYNQTEDEDDEEDEEKEEEIADSTENVTENENGDESVSNDNDLQTEKSVEIKQKKDSKRKKNSLLDFISFGRRK